MRQIAVPAVEGKVNEKEGIETLTIISSPPPQRHKLTPPGYNWFRIVPYEDGIIPYDKIKTILYLKRGDTLECYVRTCNPPSDLMVEMGYPVPESPVFTLGANTPVYGCTILPKNRQEALLVDFIINNMNRILHSMPDHSTIAVYLERVDHDLQKKIVEECLKVKGNTFNLSVSNHLRDYVINLIQSHDCYTFRGLNSEDYDHERVFPEIYSIKLTLIAHDKIALHDLVNKFGPSTIDLDIAFNHFTDTWVRTLERASTPIEYNTTLPFTATVQALRNWLILPDCSICKCIPRGTVPAQTITRPDGFKIGMGFDGCEFRLRHSDFYENCIIMNRNDDLLVTIIKNLGELYPVIVVSVDNSFSQILANKGVKFTWCPKDMLLINPFDLPDRNHANALVKTLNEVLKLDISSIRTLEPIIKTAKYISPILIIKLADYIRINKLLPKNRNIPAIINTTTYRNLYSLSLKIIEHCKDIIYDYTIIPLEDIISKSGITVFDEFSYPEARVLLIRLLTEILSQPRNYPIYIVLILPKLYKSQYITHLLEFKKYGIYFILTFDTSFDNNILDKVGLTFHIEEGKTRVRVFDEGTTVITIRKIRPAPTDPNLIKTIPPYHYPDYMVEFFGQALEFIDPNDLLRSVVLYSIYKKNNVNTIIRKLLEEIDNIHSILSWLKEKGFITDHEGTIRYNNGFEKWFKSAVPSIESDKIIRAIVDYYFSKGYCVVPVKQWPGKERPDLMAIPITLHLYFDCSRAIPVEVELSLDKGQKSLEQAHKNMVKNPEFPKKHIITLIKFRDKIMDIHNNLSDIDKKRVEIKFFDGNRILDANEAEFIEIVDHREEAENKEKSSRRKEEKQEHKVKNTYSRSLLEFIKDEESEEIVTEEIVEKPIEETTIKEAEMSNEDVKCENEKEDLTITWNDKTYILERNKDSERVVKFVNEFLEGKHKNIRIVEKDGLLKVLDEKGNVVAKAKILKII